MINQKKVPLQIQGEIKDCFGLPKCFSGSKIEMLTFINKSLKGRVSGWFSRSLSMGGKEILLKAVAMAMPIHAMSIFKLPKATISSITGAMADFWWNATEDKKKVHWKSWEKLCLDKEFGGLGFRDIECFNQALLAKQAWRILQSPDSLMASVLKSRYFEDENFLDARLGDRPSFAWKSILFGRDLLLKGLQKRIGNGEDTLVWCEQWILDSPPRIPLMKNILVDLNLLVKDLIDPGIQDWDQDVLQELFFAVDINIIIRRKPVVSKNDFLVWDLTKSGDYTVKSGYRLAAQEKNAALIFQAAALPSLICLSEEIWSLKAPKKLLHFMWKALNGALAVVDEITARGIKMDSRCQSCGNEGESINHVLFQCSAARQVWALSHFPCPDQGFHEDAVFVNFHYLLSQSKNFLIPAEIRRSFPWVLWQIWKNRNLFIFESKRFDSLEVVLKGKEDADSWHLAQAVERSPLSLMIISDHPKKPIWKPPAQDCLKCNWGMSWSKKKKLVGGAWVLRDHHGRVLLHSRRAFANVASLDEAKLMVGVWAMESMAFHKVNNIVFGVQDPEFFGAISRPKAWPSFVGQGLLLLNGLMRFPNWSLLCNQ